MDAAGFEARVCKREGCGHHQHSHLRAGPCGVRVVSGPPSDHGLIVSKEGAPEPDMHPGRTVSACGCPGFLS